MTHLEDAAELDETGKQRLDDVLNGDHPDDLKMRKVVSIYPTSYVTEADLARIREALHGGGYDVEAYKSGSHLMVTRPDLDLEDDEDDDEDDDDTDEEEGDGDEGDDD